MPGLQSRETIKSRGSLPPRVPGTHWQSAQQASPPWWRWAGLKVMSARATTVLSAIVIGAILGITAGCLLALSRNQHSFERPGIGNKVRNQPRPTGVGVARPLAESGTSLQRSYREPFVLEGEEQF
jgi:hypothetical protein